MTTRCAAGHRFDVLEAKFIGMQAGPPGEFLELHNCPTCNTTVATAVHTDASECSGCGEVILGDHGDHKTLREVGDGPWEILCVECAGKAMPPTRPPSFLLRRMGVDVGMY